MKQTILAISLFAIATAIAPSTAFAGYGAYGDCSPSYGSYNSCIPVTSLIINKTVQDPKTKNFVENLSNTDTRYSPENTVPFKVTVKNTGTVTLSNVVVTDTLPNYLNFVSAPGTYDSKSKTITIKIDKLNPGEEKTVDINGKLAASSDLPSDPMITCLVNTVSVKANGQGNNDTAQFCVEKPSVSTKGGLPVYPSQPVKSTPATGSEALTLLALIPGALTGLALRKRSMNT